MKSRASTLLLVLGVLFALTSCSGVKNACTTNCGGGNAKLSLTLSDTPPTGTSVLSFTLPISGISLTPSTGSPVSVFSGGNFELTRLQSDSALVVAGVSVPAGSYTSINVTVGTSTGIFINASSSTITYGASQTCAAGAVCKLPDGAAATISVPVTLTLTANQTQWVGLDISLNNAITSTNGITVDLTQTNVFKALTTPRTNVPSGSVDSIDDFTGVVTAYTSGSSVTVKSGTRGTMTATITSATTFDDPQNLCTGSASIASCISAGAVLSIQAYLSTSGTINATEIDVIDTQASAADEVEGVIYPSSCNGGNNFGLILADSTVVSGDTTLSGLTFGAGFCITVSPSAVFLTDTGLLFSAIGNAVQPGFTGSNNLAAGQVVRFQVSNVVAGSIVNATATSALLRPSRLSGTVNIVSGNNFSMNGLPAYLGFVGSPLTATYINNTIFEGVTGVSSLTNSQSVAVRALFFANSGNSPQSGVNFFAAKVRAN